MSDIAASEQRLIAALDRIDRSIVAATRGGDAAPRPAGGDGAAEIARLVAANEQLAAANRALIAAEDGAAVAALKAEVEALNAARAAEAGRMGEILGAIETLLDHGAAEGATEPDAAADAAEQEGR